MSDWMEGDVTVNNARLHYYRTRGGGAPVLLVHGFTDNGLCWTPVARDLEDRYDVIMVDARGHGLSDPVSVTPSLDLPADLAGFIEALGLDRPAVLGHSMGASAAAQLAAGYPGLVGAALLEDPAWFGQDPDSDPVAIKERWRKRHATWRQGALIMQTRSRDELVAIVHAEHPTWGEAELGPWADAKLQLDIGVFDAAPMPDVPWPDVARDIACPTLLITAEPAMGSIVTPEIAEEALALLRRGSLAHVAGAGHSIRREGYAAYMEAVTSFLAAWEVTRC